MNTTNVIIRKMEENKIKKIAIARALNVNPSTVTRNLRTPMSDNEYRFKRYLLAIEEVIAEREERA